MNILYDSYIYALQKTGGINRYFTEIIAGLPPSFHPFLFKKVEENIFAPHHPKLKNLWIPNSLRFSNALLALRMRSIDLIHPTYYHLCQPLLWENIPGKVVITVHDFTIARFAQRYSRSAKLIKDQTAAIKRADYIICVSHATRDDLLERFPECEMRSSVIPLASSLTLPNELMRNPFEKRYFLYIGARTFYKNFILTLHAFAVLQKKYADLQLVVAGPPWSDDEKQLIKELGIFDSLNIVEYPDDLQLGALYRNAVALFYPSEHEGFGLPPLEAMKMGVPVIALKTSSLPEVVGEGGILIDPEHVSPSVLAEAAESLLNSESLWHHFSCEGLKQASKFSWEKTVQQTLNVYSKLM
ncbi:MAG TPA: glycosyltransferase family 1 protein [Chthoniobacterales bacterium]|nr:glycosyltransferase family 1 protein [Chthoniobacterales bacterium]